ncbi:hypothetical protein PtB15_4B771 [Puccinia triticina]|nr:hypothetical protein PtB15_4B771 [Puccinia triticina]
MNCITGAPWLVNSCLRENLVFQGKFKAGSSWELTVGGKESLFESSGLERNVTNSYAVLASNLSSTFPQIAVTLTQYASDWLELESGEFYELEGEVLVGDELGNQNFHYYTSGFQRRRYTRSAAIPDPVKMTGCGTIFHVKVVDNKRRDGGVKSIARVELIVAHGANVGRGAVVKWK